MTEPVAKTLKLRVNSPLGPGTIVSVPPLLAVPLFEVLPQAARSVTRTRSSESRAKTLPRPYRSPGEDVECGVMGNLLAMNLTKRAVLHESSQHATKRCKY